MRTKALAWTHGSHHLRLEGDVHLERDRVFAEVTRDVTKKRQARYALGRAHSRRLSMATSLLFRGRGFHPETVLRYYSDLLILGSTV
jgi:hypothetical protein